MASKAKYIMIKNYLIFQATIGIKGLRMEEATKSSQEVQTILQKELEQEKIDAELKKQKDEQFEIRKNRFLELEVELNGEYFMNTNGIVCDRRDVFNSDAIDSISQSSAGK